MTTMTGKRRFLGAVLAVGMLGGCEPLDDGGGGGIGDVLFTRGFAFVREDDRNVFVVDDNGDANSPQRLTNVGGAYWPSVSRDGRSVVFVQRSGGTTSLLTVPTSGGTPSTLFRANDSTCARGCSNFRTPTFSPDGRSVVFVFSPGNSSQTALARINTDGSGFQELTPNNVIAYGAPSFLPNGSAVLAGAGSGLNQLDQLAHVPLNGGTITYSSLSAGVQFVENRVAVSPNGSQVALDGRLSSGGTRIFVGQLSGSNVGALQRVTSGGTGEESWPSWTGASQLGFLISAGGSDTGIYRANLSTGSVSLAVPSATEPSYGPI
ncbi:PD40 domain-containing protein [Myxococcus sp. AB056]|uniref:TolB family protein n=1 Tax=Myxococcus sp. AB056 TaxID=2562792 RepID=UPI001146EBD7|nr:PD40 domain-containing protein [Myxococcus sp. AB056]